MIELRDCHDCGAKPGEPHQDGCDMARCLITGQQLIQCGGEEHEYKGRWYGEHDGDCGHDIWTGESNGCAECREYDFWCYWQEPSGSPYGKWIPCAADHPKAREDLNRLHTDCVWDPEKTRWVLKVTA